MTFTDYQKEIAIRGPCVALRFLVRAEERPAIRAQMVGFPDAAIFYRWMELHWTFADPESVAILSEAERNALDRFNAEFVSLPWVPMESHPFVSGVPESELIRLVPYADTLLTLLERRLAHRPPRTDTGDSNAGHSSDAPQERTAPLGISLGWYILNLGGNAVVALGCTIGACRLVMGNSFSLALSTKIGVAVAVGLLLSGTVLFWQRHESDDQDAA